jgi:chromosomal replication initiation ATPase DnaA
MSYVAVSSKHTMAGAKKRAFSQKDHFARQAALEDVTRSIARIERIAEQEGIRNQTAKLIETAATRLARSKGAVTSYRTIERRVCAVFKVTAAQIAGRGRNSPALVLARQAIMYWAKRLTLMSPQEIGRRMGGRDHSTVYHGIDVYPGKRAKHGRMLRRIPRVAEFKGRKR